MKHRLKDFIDTIFSEAPVCTKADELKEQMYRDVCDKYDDLLSEGKTPAAAYNACVIGIGDVTPLIEEMRVECGKSESCLKTAESLVKEKGADDDVAPLSYGIMNAIAVALYIICWVPLAFISELRLFGDASDAVGIVILMLFVAVATALMLLKRYTLPAEKRAKIKSEEAEEEKTKVKKTPVEKMVDGIIWGMTLALYFFISFITGAWHISWILFVIAAAIENITEALFELVGRGDM